MDETLTPPPGPSADVAERVRWCVSVARYAPSKHNAQPWRFTLRDDGAVDLHADATRSLAASDPEDRELTIGCGAALYTFALALRGLGWTPRVRLLPEGSGGPLATVSPGAHAVPSVDDLTLLAAVPHRHTNRGPLDALLMNRATPFLLQRAAEGEGAVLQLVTTLGAQNAVDTLVARADRVVAYDPAVAAELASWLRPPGSDAGDGVPFGAGTQGVYGARYAQRTFGDLPRDVDRDRPLPAVLWTAGDAQRDWLRAGTALQAVLLRATVEGVGASFLNQPLERRESRVAVRREVGFAGFPQVILRLGIGADVPATPRRPAGDLLDIA